MLISVHIRGHEVFAQAGSRDRAHQAYLLDTNLPQNSEVDRLITGHLYGGDTETRIVQEKVLGIGGVGFCGNRIRAVGFSSERRSFGFFNTGIGARIY